MPITYAFDAAHGRINARVAGPTSLADVTGYFDAIAAEPWFPAPALTDVRDATITLTNDEIRTIVDRLRQLAPRLAGAPLAVLVGSNVSFGLVRMIEQLLSETVDVRAFRDTDSALAWLEEMRRSKTSAS